MASLLTASDQSPQASKSILTSLCRPNLATRACPERPLGFHGEQLCHGGIRLGEEDALPCDDRKATCRPLEDQPEKLATPAPDVARLRSVLPQGFMPLPTRPQEALSDRIARIEQAASKRREVERTRARPAKEKQFNRKVEINATLRQLKSELEQLSRRPPISKAQRPKERTWTN